MGTRGPTPKRSDKKLGHTSKADRDATTRAPGAEVVEVPDPDPEWHPVASQWFVALAESGQSQFYEPSDWATAWFLAETMSRELKPQGLVHQGDVVSYHTMTIKAGALSALLKGMSDLMVTEGSRRRVSIELQRPQPEQEEAAEVTDMRSWRANLG